MFMAAKIIIGLVLLLIGLWLILPVEYCAGLGCQGLWTNLWFVILGVVPISLIMFGILLVWVETEELKISKRRRKK